MKSGVWHGVFILWELLSCRNAGYLEKYGQMVFLYQKQVKIASQELLMGGDGDWKEFVSKRLWRQHNRRKTGERLTSLKNSRSSQSLIKCNHSGNYKTNTCAEIHV